MNYEFPNRLQTLRKQHGFSQEQLADLLGISRQAVSKWESGQSLPDIDNLVRLSELYGESLDSLVKGVEAPAPVPAPQTAEQPQVVFAPFGMGLVRLPLWNYEYKSRTTLWGLPLVHIHMGRTANGRLAVAKGIFAVGTVAVGLVSAGLFSLGLLSVGVLALGLLVLATLGLGILTAGIVSIGLLAAFGICAIGYLAVGVATVGVYTSGVAAVAAKVAVGVVASAPVAIGSEKVDGLRVMLVNATNTADDIRAFIQLHASSTPAWIARILAFFSGIL